MELVLGEKCSWRFEPGWDLFSLSFLPRFFPKQWLKCTGHSFHCYSLGSEMRGDCSRELVFPLGSLRLVMCRSMPSWSRSIPNQTAGVTPRIRVFANRSVAVSCTASPTHAGVVNEFRPAASVPQVTRTGVVAVGWRQQGAWEQSWVQEPSWCSLQLCVGWCLSALFHRSRPCCLGGSYPWSPSGSQECFLSSTLSSDGLVSVWTLPSLLLWEQK